jgi:hypothetical protein
VLLGVELVVERHDNLRKWLHLLAKSTRQVAENTMNAVVSTAHTLGKSLDMPHLPILADHERLAARQQTQQVRLDAKHLRSFGGAGGSLSADHKAQHPAFCKSLSPHTSQGLEEGRRVAPLSFWLWPATPALSVFASSDHFFHHGGMLHHLCSLVRVTSSHS